jgi:uncharacterized protein YdaU (DUF1376 family)
MASETKVDVWMPLYVSDFLTATLGWTAEERGHYLTLLMAQWAIGSLPGDPEALERISPGVSGCWAILGPKFPAAADGRLRNARLEEHRSDSIANREKKVAAAKAANEAKRAKAASTQTEVQADTQTVMQTDVQTVSECTMPSPSPSPSPSEKKKNKPAAQVPTSKPRAASSPAAKISWAETSGFSGISEQDRSEWARAYPGAELERELAKAHAWLRANPKKAGKRNWRLFVVRWLARCQDNGGTTREIGRRPAEPPVAPRVWTGEDAAAFERTRRKLALERHA